MIQNIPGCMFCKHKLYIIYYSILLYIIWLQVPHFTESLCYQQILNGNMSTQGTVLALALALDEGKAEARRESQLPWLPW